MSLLALHLNDAGVLLTDGERILCREPGFALLEDDGVVTGREAWAVASLKPRRIQNRFWAELSTTPLTDRRFQHLSAADLASKQLESIWKRTAQPGAKLVLAVPPYMSTESLGLLLGVAQDLEIPIVGMVDAAVAAMTSMLEPLLMIFLGVMVGGLVVAMYLPIFKLAGVVGG